MGSTRNIENSIDSDLESFDPIEEDHPARHVADDDENQNECDHEQPCNCMETQAFQTEGSDVEASDSDDDIFDRCRSSDSSDIPDSDEDSETEDVSNCAQLKDWSNDLGEFPKTLHEFTSESGLKIDIDQEWSPSSCMKLFINEFVVKLLKEETNRYASDISRDPRYQNTTIVKEWKPVTLKEIKGFILMLVHMVKKLSLDDFWSPTLDMYRKLPSTVLPLKRFSAILSMLHFSNNENYVGVNKPDQDPLFKMRTLCEHFQTRFQQVYVPEQNVSVVEALCSWKGDLGFITDLKHYPIPCGIKFTEVCESQSGYVYQFEIYAADSNVSNNPRDVALRILTPLLDQGYHVFTGRNFTCPSLYEELIKRKTMCTGHVSRTCKEIPTEFSREKLRVRQSAYLRKDDLVTLKWRDKYMKINILSSVYNPEKLSYATVSSTRRVPKPEPDAVIAYSRNMFWADEKDEELQEYIPLQSEDTQERTHRKWTTKLFCYLFSLSLYQACIISNKVRALKDLKALEMNEFIDQLWHELKDEYFAD